MTARSTSDVCESGDGIAGNDLTVFAPFTVGAPPSTAAGDRLTGRRHFMRSVAYHESGHAVVSRVCNLAVAGVTILFDGRSQGAVWADDAHRFDPPSETDRLIAALRGLMPKPFESRDGVASDLLRTSDQIVSLLAGPEAGRLFLGSALPGTEHDDTEARAFAALVCRSSSSVDSFIEFCRCEARALLLDHRGAVTALAEALIEHQTLTGAQVDAIIRGAA